ncbi:MAG: Gfo/Idh/MocA family oxidoreductase [Thermoproteota archaeon]
MSIIRVGIVGCGGIARGTHVPYYRKMSDVEVVACADVDVEAARSLAEDFKIPRYYTDFNEMFDKEELDAVSVCTPNMFHKDPTVAALKAGAHVLTEKPMAGNLRDALEMYETSKRTGRILIVGFQTRFKPDLNMLRNMVNEGELGEIYYSRAMALRRWGIPPRKTLISRKLAGAGPLFDIGCYAVDFTMYIMNFPQPKSAFGVFYTKFGNNPEMAKRGCWGGTWSPIEFEVEDNAFGMVKFKNGFTMLLETNWASFIDRDRFSVELLGTSGGAQLDPFEIYREIQGVRVTIRPQDQMPNVDIYEMRIRKFIESVKEGRPLFSPAIEGLRVQAILEAIYRSAVEDREIPVEWDF